MLIVNGDNYNIENLVFILTVNVFLIGDIYNIEILVLIGTVIVFSVGDIYNAINVFSIGDSYNLVEFLTVRNQITESTFQVHWIDFYFI